jgi:hypothetical protein
MSTKSRDQRRKEKLAERSKRARERPEDASQPYAGTKYQAERWVPYVLETEQAVYEAILVSGRRLSNDQVQAAFTSLIQHLRDGQPPLLGDDPIDVPFAAGAEVEFLVYNIRRHWAVVFERAGFVNTEDLIGILRTLLHSMKAHAWNTGRDRGYVAFLYKFMSELTK